MDVIVKELLATISDKLGTKVINIITYADITNVKDSTRLRNVLIHLVTETE